MPLCYLFLLLALSAGNSQTSHATAAMPPAATSALNPYSTIGAIPPPPGFSRLPCNNSTYTAWLRQLRLKKNKTVYLFNGQPKTNQQAQFAVLDIPVGNKDLQQCADAVMRLRAEYLYAQKKLGAIDFSDNDAVHYRLPAGADRSVFDQYLEKVFSRCGTASLEKQLLPITDFESVTAGDVLIRGGHPGHAMQVMDIAVNKEGKKAYLLAQSYMPAQDIHVVINPASTQLSPWYEVDSSPRIETPEWDFLKSQLRKWPTEK